MTKHLHPDTQVPILGMRLAPGAVLQGDDCYASSDGRWQKSPGTAGLTLKASQAVWIRPDVELSSEAEDLLKYLAKSRFYLAKREWWVFIPALRWKDDGRMDWKVRHPECIQELKDYGFIQPCSEDETVYELSDASRLAAEEFV